MTTVEISELCAEPPTTSGPSMLSEVRDVFNHGTTLNNVAGDVHHHTYNYTYSEAGQNEPELARPAESSSSLNQTELPSQLYSRLLLREARGYPLMDPTLPSELPDEYQSNGVMIGDVGLVTEDGYFDVLFNICEPADGPINGGYVPEGFVKLNRPPDSKFNYRSGRSYQAGQCAVSHSGIRVSSSILDGETPENSNEYAYRFQCGLEEGAILALPSGASRKDLMQRKEFLDYAVKHGVSWYEFVNQTLGRLAENGSIYLITGYDKTRSWGTASLLAGNMPTRTNLHFTNTGWHPFGQAFVKYRTNPQANGTPPENQCVFLRGYKVTLSNRTLAKMLGISVVKTSPLDEITPNHGQWNVLTLFEIVEGFKAVLQNMTSKNDIPTSSAASEEKSGFDPPIVTPIIRPLSSVIHPSNLINLYLLSKFPESDLAVTHDSIWCSYLTIQPDTKSLFEYIDTDCMTTQRNGAIYLVDYPEDMAFYTGAVVSAVPRLGRLQSNYALADNSVESKAHSDNELPFVLKPLVKYDEISQDLKELAALAPHRAFDLSPARPITAPEYLVTEQEVSQSYLSATLTTIQPLPDHKCLLVLALTCHPAPGRRFENAKITWHITKPGALSAGSSPAPSVMNEKDPLSPHSSIKPKIISSAPTHSVGGQTKEQTQLMWGLPLPVQAGQVAAYVGEETSLERETSEAIRHAMPTQSSIRSLGSRTTWTVVENSSSQRGIPSNFQVAIVVQHGGSFQMDLDIKAGLAGGSLRTNIVAKKGKANNASRIIDPEVWKCGEVTWEPTEAGWKKYFAEFTGEVPGTSQVEFQQKMSIPSQV